MFFGKFVFIVMIKAKVPKRRRTCHKIVVRSAESVKYFYNNMVDWVNHMVDRVNNLVDWLNNMVDWLNNIVDG